ncbi:hypothetical protein [Phenylobacterium sp.]|uniref:hypothetical protein n=1 Tax=Phenylobacterium sp. TaxID=1871053 RepID=UPI00286BBEE3|nr:hypothetical protein [Phenylobacterium sp.]
MDLLKERRTVLVLAGGAVALIAGALAAWILVAAHRGETSRPPPASSGGLVIDSGGVPDQRLDPAKPLRCFVAGRSVGELTLAQCARRNGVSTDALDVGIDRTGALAAAGQAGTVLTPLPPSEQRAPQDVSAEAATTPAVGPAASPAGACLRYAEGQWRRLPGEMPLTPCVQALFAGRCERPGAAAYGRWMQQTLRLVPGRVEISADNRSFRPLVDQPACAVPAG